MALRVYTHVREDALQLYGFLTDLERQLFERLIGVSGIGPKLAVALLSGMEPRDLLTCRAARRRRAADRHARHRQEDRRAHRAGAEGSRRRSSASPPDADAPAAQPPSDRLRGDVLSALQNLGYHRPLAEKAVDAALADGAADASTFEQALKGALKALHASRDRHDAMLTVPDQT